MALGNKTSSILDLRDNWIINGDMQFSQRGDYDTAPVSISNGVYTIDRVRFLLVTNTATIQRMSSNLPEGFNYSIRATATSTAIGRVGSFQQIEDYGIFFNKAIIFSAWVKSNSVLARLRLFDGISNFTSTPHSGNGEWEYLSIPCTVNSSVSQLLAATSITDATGVGSVSINSGDYIECTGLKLEFGSVATEFVPRPIFQELAYCQRYFESGVCMWATSRYYTRDLHPLAGCTYKVTKRIRPTIIIKDNNGVAGQMLHIGGGGAVTWNGIGESKTDIIGVYIRCNQDHNSTYKGFYTADAEM